MTERRVAYKAGTAAIRPGAGSELHRVAGRYEVLLEPGDRAEARAWRGEMPAGDVLRQKLEVPVGDMLRPGRSKVN